MSDRLVYGVHPVRLALEGGEPVARILVVDGRVGDALRVLLGLAEAAGVAVERVPRRRLDRLCPQGAHQGVVAELPPFPYSDLEEVLRAAGRAEGAPLLIACDRVQDPRNLGAILRSAAAFGAHGVLLPRHEAAAVTPAAERTAAGAASALPVAIVANLARALDRAREAGLWVAAAAARGGAVPEAADLTVPLCLVLGGEARGPRPGVLSRCDLALSIPLPGGVESLNVAAAAAVLLYEVGRQRGGGTLPPTRHGRPRG